MHLIVKFFFFPFAPTISSVKIIIGEAKKKKTVGIAILITAINELLMKGTSDRRASFFFFLFSFIYRHCPDANDGRDLNNLKTRACNIDGRYKNHQCLFIASRKKDYLCSILKHFRSPIRGQKNRINTYHWLVIEEH